MPSLAAHGRSIFNYGRTIALLNPSLGARFCRRYLDLLPVRVPLVPQRQMNHRRLSDLGELSRFTVGPGSSHTRQARECERAVWSRPSAGIRIVGRARQLGHCGR